MSLSDMRPFVRLAFALAITTAVVGCQVRPLYSDVSPNAAGVTSSAALSSVSVDEVTSRVAQEVRNHLIFALSGGAGEPANPAYTLDIGVTSQVLSVAAVRVSSGSVNRPTAGSIVLTALYSLKDGSGQQVASGKRSATASFDRPVQQFASLRAQRDAENRAARELAEVLKLAVAADLSK